MKYQFLKSGFTSILNRHKQPVNKKTLAGVLMLTSLIDAFSILVIYLLMSFSSSGEMSYINTNMELPQAETLERLNRYSLLRITKDSYAVGEQIISVDKLVSSLLSLREKLIQQHGKDSQNISIITLQADKEIKYSRLSSVIQACSQAGFSEIKFAVLGDGA